MRECKRKKKGRIVGKEKLKIYLKLINWFYIMIQSPTFYFTFLCKY